jgi:hypothetical protein
VVAPSVDAGACERLASTQPAPDGIAWACADTDKHVYCMDAQGRIERRARAGTDAPRLVASGRPGTRIAAADVAGHEVVLFLDNRKTSEGIVMQAFASIDGAAPARVSEDGAGATSVDVAPRGKAGIIAYVDARGAMAPVHARSLVDRYGALELGKDAVVFLGGAPDPFVAGVLATAGDRAYFLLPIAKEASTFGMAIVTIDDPPRDDEPVTWSMYRAGLDPAPIAATRGAGPIRVARVQPRAIGLGVPRDLELGTITAQATFATYGFITENSAVARLAIYGGSDGKVRVARADARGGTLVDTLRCP